MSGVRVITPMGSGGEFLDKPIKLCDVQIKTRFGLAICGYRPEFVIVNMRQAGYIPVCRYHRDEFVEHFGVQPEVYIVLTLEEFEAQRRKGLYTIFDIPTLA